MLLRFSSVLIFLFISVIIPGCSTSSPIAPLTEPGKQIPGTRILRESSHQTWGLWDITCDQTSGLIESTPLRTAEFNANVTRFLQPPSAPINLLTISLQPGSDIANGLWVLDITLRHPFLEYKLFRGFDVHGIIIAEGGQSGIHDPSLNYHSTGGTRLLNPDGYTRWWNPTEFTTFGTILGYTEGKKAIPGDFASATINPYKLYSDSLDEEAPVISIDQASRATFATYPGNNKRRYKIQFDLDGGTPPIRFKYAIDASWSLPDPAFSPDYPVESYDLSANCQEPYLLMVPFFEEKPYYENESIYGGDAVFFLTIGDWQILNGGSVLDQLTHIWIESPTLLDTPVDVLPTAEFVSLNAPTQETYRITVPDCHPTGLFDQKFLITAESKNPDTYAPQIQGDPNQFAWPDSPLAAYMLVDVPISPNGPQPDDEYVVVGLPDWCSLTEFCTSGADNLQLITNLVTWDLDGPANDNLNVKWWSGHVQPTPPYSTSIIANHITSLGYFFWHTFEDEFNADGFRMVIVNFVTSPGGHSLPFTDVEVSRMKDFVKSGGILAFLIENPTYCDSTHFDTLMDQLGVPLGFGGPAEPPSDTTLTTDITDHYLTTGVNNFQYWTCGEFLLESPDCESLVRTPSGETIICTAPIQVD